MIKESRGTTRRDQEEVEERQEEREEPVETLQIDNLSEDKRSDSYNFEEGLDEVWTWWLTKYQNDYWSEDYFEYFFVEIAEGGRILLFYLLEVFQDYPVVHPHL